MTKPIRVLVIEDSEDDEELLRRTLEKGGYDPFCHRVETAEEMNKAMKEDAWDLILSDFNLPGFGGLTALSIFKETGLDIPFILVSGAIGEDQAVAAMKAGAHDYVMKERLQRLPLAVERELHEAEDRRQRRLAEVRLKEANRRLEEALHSLEKTQSQVIQQERLSALGQMASGIAHDFNNALTAIQGFSDLLLLRPEKLDDKEMATNYIRFIHTAATDAATVVDRMRAFYRPRSEDDVFGPVHLHEIAADAISLTRPRWKNQARKDGVTILLESEVEIGAVALGMETELRQAAINLIFNSTDAMEKDGRIVIRGWEEDETIIMEVVDSGRGMLPGVKDRCFEPFFTTKGVDGTGLGLATIHGIVSRHGGAISVESSPGEGTTIRLKLPVYTGDQESSQEGPQFAARSPRRILVVDDEPMCREVCGEYLMEVGHTVVLAQSGVDALEVFQREIFDLVVSDQAMPGMSGEQLAAAVKETHPDVPVLLLTGFGSLMEVAGERPIHVDAIQGKPIQAGRLLAEIDKLLAAT